MTYMGDTCSDGQVCDLKPDLTNMRFEQSPNGRSLDNDFEAACIRSI